MDGDVHALEISMESDSGATHLEDIASLSGKIDKLSVYSCQTELEDVRKAFRTRYLKMKREMESRVHSKAVLLASLPSSDGDTHSSISSPAASHSSGGNIRLPKIELLTFDGKQIHWPVF